jgi:hypothetical protein
MVAADFDFVTVWFKFAAGLWEPPGGVAHADNSKGADGLGNKGRGSTSNGTQ